MPGFERMDRLLADAGVLAGHLVPVGRMFASAGGAAEVRTADDQEIAL
jgi:hypothetical protein